jgi:hypothetical protein
LVGIWRHIVKWNVESNEIGYRLILMSMSCDYSDLDVNIV